MKTFESIKIIFWKESLDHMRDRRSLVLSFVFPLLAPLMVGLLLYFINTNNIQGSEEFQMDGPVAGAENAPALMTYLTEHGITLTPAPVVREFQESAVKSGALPFILVIPETAVDTNIYKLEIITDRASPKSMVPYAP